MFVFRITSPLLGILSLVLSAQAQDSTQPIPQDLALALLSGMRPEGEKLEIRVARGPDQLPRGVLPADGQILGTLLNSRGSTVVVRVPQSLDTALAKAEARVIAAGWRKPDRPQLRGGFVPAPYRFPVSFCRGDQHLSISAVPGAPGSIVKVSIYQPGEGFSCGERPRPRPSMDSPLPPLLPPEGVRSRLGGACGGGDHFESSVRLWTSLSPAQLLGHYTAQLERAGWRAGPAAIAGDVATRTLVIRDKGTTWVGILTAAAHAGTDQREMVVRTMRPSTD